MVLMFPLISMMIYFTGCSTESENLEPEDEISGIYMMEGRKTVTTSYEGSEPDKKFSNILIPVKVAWDASKPDLVRFYGLEGTDSGSFKNKVYLNCTRPDDCPVYATKTDDQLEFNLAEENRIYSGNGWIDIGYRVIIHFNTTFQSENILMEFELIGAKNP